MKIIYPTGITLLIVLLMTYIPDYFYPEAFLLFIIPVLICVNIILKDL
jgi:hypothetical protein